MRFTLAATSLQTVLAEVLPARGDMGRAGEMVARIHLTDAVERTIAGPTP